MLMTFTGLNLTGVIIAFIFSFISGAIWFGPKTFYPIWMKARGNATGQLTKQGRVLGFVDLNALGVVSVVLQSVSGNPGDSLVPQAPRPAPTVTVFVTPTPTPSE